MGRGLFLPTIDTPQEQCLPPLLPLTALRINQIASMIGNEIAHATAFLEHLKRNTEQDLGGRLQMVAASLPLRVGNVVTSKMIERWTREQLTRLHALQEEKMEDSLEVPEDLEGQDLFRLLQGLHSN